MKEGIGVLRGEEMVVTTYFSDRVIMRVDEDGETPFVSLRTERGAAWLALADIQAVINTLERMKEDILRETFR
jgi:hypothetical protein